MLWESFGDGFALLDTFPGQDAVHPAVLRAFLAAHPLIKAVSSHRVHPPWGVRGALPIVMIRHPLDRARSAYRYARCTPATPEHAIARDADFAAYVDWALARPGEGATLRDHQVQHLSAAAFRKQDPAQWRATAADLEQAKATLAAMPAFGLVRRFAESCSLFNACYRPRLPAARFGAWAENTTGDAGQTEAQALADVREELGEATYRRLGEANTLDLELHAFATRLFDARLARLGSAPVRAGNAVRLLIGRVRQRVAEPHLYPRGKPGGLGSARHPTEPACIRLPPPGETVAFPRQDRCG